MPLHLPLDRPGLREDPGVVNGELVSDRARIGPPEPLDCAQLLAVHAVLLRVLVVPVVERPALVVLRLDDERVAFPVADRLAVERRLDVRLVRTPVERNDA